VYTLTYTKYKNVCAYTYEEKLKPRQVGNSFKVTILAYMLIFMMKEGDILNIGGFKKYNKLIIYKNK
jgi:hypothetical protein